MILRVVQFIKDDPPFIYLDKYYIIRHIIRHITMSYYIMCNGHCMFQVKKRNLATTVCIE